MRLFIAFDVDDASIVNKVMDIQRILVREGVKGTFPNQEQLHVTIKFLGETPDDKVELLKARLAEIRAPKFEVFFDGVTGFPSLSSPRVVVIRLLENDTLLKIFNDIEKITSSMGFRRESRAFKPHLTIARVKKPWSWKRHLVKVLSGVSIDMKMTIECIKLKKSTLTPTGPIYEDVDVYWLERGV